MPKVSVIVPVYNAEKYIARCIESVKAQTLTDWEMILVDDASLDNSVEYLVPAAELDDRIHYIINTENVGPMVARHKGVMAATGDYITFLDSDDTLPEKALEILYNVAKVSNADIVSGNILFINIDGSKKSISSQLKYGSDKISVFKSLLKYELEHNLCSKLFFKGLLQDNQYEVFPNAKMGEDACLLYQIVDNAAKTVQIEDYVYNYYYTSTSSSHKRKTDAEINSILLACSTQEKICGKYPELKLALFSRICKSISAMYAQGYRRETSLEKLVDEMSLRKYVKLKGMIRNMNFKVIIEITIKTCFFPLFRIPFDGWRLK